MSKDLNLSDEQLVLKSPASVVAMFLDLITGRPIQLDLGIPIQNPDTYTLVQTAGEALRLCGEYECSSAIKFCLISLRDFLEVADGILTERIFLLACEFGDTEMAIRAVNFFYKLENKGKQNLHERRGRGEPHLESEGSPRVHFEVDPFIGWDLTAMSLENFQKIPHTVILAYLRTIQFQLIVRASELRKLPWDKISDYMRLMVRGQRKIEDSQSESFIHRIRPINLSHAYSLPGGDG